MGCQQGLHRYGEYELGVPVASLETAVTQADRAHLDRGITSVLAQAKACCRALVNAEVGDLSVNCLAKGNSKGV